MAEGYNGHVENSQEILWTGGFFNERFPAPVSPLAWSLLGPLIEQTALREPLRYLGYPEAETIPLTRLWDGHPYSNVRAFQIFYKVFPDFLVPEDAYRYFPEGNVALRKQVPYPRSILDPRFLLAMLRGFLSDPADFSPFHNYRKWADYTLQHDLRVNALRGRLQALAQADKREVVAALAEAEGISRDFLRIHRWSLMHADLTFGLLRRLARKWLDREHGDEIAARWVAGTTNKTMQVDTELRQLADLARDALPGAADWDEFTRRASPAARDAFVDFLSVHGHRSFSLDIAFPTFAEEPVQVVRLLQGMQERRAEAVAAPAADLRRLSLVQRWALGVVRSLAVRYVALREDQRYYWQKSLALSRQLYLILADKMVRNGVIPERADVFYATHAEVIDYAEGKAEELSAKIAARKLEWERYREESRGSPATAFPLFIRGDNPLVARVESRQSWQGRAVSPGSTRGMARVVQSAQELGRVRRGEILVAPSTDPAWTPVFDRIAGLVLERGGVLSHGAVVAREYHVPAVAGIVNIANEIHDGEMIEVDGNRGLVKRVE